MVIVICTNLSAVLNYVHNPGMRFMFFHPENWMDSHLYLWLQMFLSLYVRFSNSLHFNFNLNGMILVVYAQVYSWRIQKKRSSGQMFGRGRTK